MSGVPRIIQINSLVIKLMGLKLATALRNGCFECPNRLLNGANFDMEPNESTRPNGIEHNSVTPNI